MALLAALALTGCGAGGGEDGTPATVRDLPGVPTSEQVWFAGLVYERE